MTLFGSLAMGRFFSFIGYFFVLDSIIDYSAANKQIEIKKEPPRRGKLLGICGGPSGARTPNLLIKSQLLYQLS